MKRKFYQHDSEIIKVFIGYYKSTDTILAISKDKELVSDYLILNRKLSQKQYYIEKETMELSYLYSHYEDKIINNFYNLAIPSIDIKIIEKEYGDLNKELESVLNKMKYFALLLNNTKGGIDDLLNIKESIKSLEDYKENPKKNKRLTKTHLLSHPILTCNINEYFQLLKMYKEDKERIERYKYMYNND